MASSVQDREASIRRSLFEATDETGLLAALAAMTWFREGNRDGCPADKIPAESDLVEWLPACPPDVFQEAADKLSKLLTDSIGVSKQSLTWGTDDGGRLIAASADAPADLSPGFKQVVYIWQYVTLGMDAEDRPKKDPGRPKHPLAPLVAAWQRARSAEKPFRPVRVARLPAMHKTAKDSDRKLLAIPGASGPAGGDSPQIPLTLNAQIPVSWLIQAWEQGAAKVQDTKSAMAFRLFVYALLHVPLDQRGGNRFTFRWTVREIEQMLFLGRWINRSRDWQKLRAALTNLRNIMLPLHGTSGYWFPVTAETMPGERPDPDFPVVVSARLPASSKEGAARIDWPALQRYGAMLRDWSKPLNSENT